MTSVAPADAAVRASVRLIDAHRQRRTAASGGASDCRRHALGSADDGCDPLGALDPDRRSRPVARESRALPRLAGADDSAHSPGRNRPSASPLRSMPASTNGVSPSLPSCARHWASSIGRCAPRIRGGAAVVNATDSASAPDPAVNSRVERRAGVARHAARGAESVAPSSDSTDGVARLARAPAARQSALRTTVAPGLRRARERRASGGTWIRSAWSRGRRSRCHRSAAPRQIERQPIAGVDFAGHLHHDLTAAGRRPRCRAPCRGCPGDRG